MNGFAGLVNFACFLSLLTAIGLRGLHLHGEDNRLREREREELRLSIFTAAYRLRFFSFAAVFLLGLFCPFFLVLL